MNVTIRPAQPQERGLLAGYQQQMALETEGLALDPDVLRAGIQRLFDEPAKGSYWVFEQDGQPIGCVLTLTEWSDWRNGDVLWIHSLFVEPQCRGKGVFRQAYEHFQRLVLETEGLRGIRLYVDRRNHKAQQAYQALGMTKEHYELYEWLA
jgi:GNAT superfamily N-acetyltransferase